MLTTNSPNLRGGVLSQGQELPAVTDWQDFTEWCRRERRQALPASDETLQLYFRAKAHLKQEAEAGVERLGWAALAMMVLGVLGPIGVFLAMAASTGELALSHQGALLLFAGMQLMAMTLGWASRESIAGRAAWRTAILATVALLGANVFLGGGSGVETLRELVVR